MPTSNKGHLQRRWKITVIYFEMDQCFDKHELITNVNIKTNDVKYNSLTSDKVSYTFPKKSRVKKCIDQSYNQQCRWDYLHSGRMFGRICRNIIFRDFVLESKYFHSNNGLLIN